MKYQVHASAIVDEGARIGDDTRVWHWTHVCAGASIGTGCSIGQNVYIANEVNIGNNCKIQNNVSVYDRVTLEDDVFCGPSMVFTNVSNPRAFIDRKNEYKNTLVKRGATLGANCCLVCGITVGEYAFVAAGALVNRDVSAFSLVAGVPARQTGWVSKAGEKLDLPLTGNARAKCPVSGDEYQLENGSVTCLST